MKLSILIPAYNEKETIKEVLRRVKNADIGKTKKEIIVVDDFSTDGTIEVLKTLDDKNIKIIFHEKNYGKGHAIRTALKHSTGDIIIIQDADLEYNPEDYYKLIEPILKNKARVVYGSRVLNKNNKYSTLSFYLGGRLLSFLTNILYNTNITDEPTCYKLFKKEVLDEINFECEKFEFCPEVTAKVTKKGIKILEIPISYNPRNIKQGKKIRWKDGVIAAWTLIKYRFKH